MHTPPLNLDMRCHSSGVLPDGRTVPLAWDFSTEQMMMKVARWMPWNSNGSKQVLKILDQGGEYLCVDDEWYRGVWIPAPENITDADYTRDQQQKLASGQIPKRLAQQTTAGWTSGGYMEKSGGSTIDAETEEPETEEPEAETEPEPEGESESYNARGGGQSLRARVARRVVAVAKAKKKRKR